MTADDTSQAQTGAWLPIPEAAKQLGIHVRTVHRWLDDGRLTKRELARGRVEVWVPNAMLPDDPPESTPAAPQGTPGGGLAVLGQHLAILERQGEISAQQMAPLVEELAATRQQMAEMAQQMTAQGEEIGRLREIERENGRLRAELLLARRPWWRFW